METDAPPNMLPKGVCCACASPPSVGFQLGSLSLTKLTAFVCISWHCCRIIDLRSAGIAASSIFMTVLMAPLVTHADPVTWNDALVNKLR